MTLRMASMQNEPPGLRKRLLTALSTLTLTAATALACGSTEGGDGSGTHSAGSVNTIDDLLREVAVGLCRGDCGETSAIYIETAYGGECLETLTLLYETIGATFHASLDAGRASFDAEQAQRCLDLRAANECTEAELACESIFIGHVPVGEACNSSDECAGNAYCSEGLACPGTCVATLDPGEACSFAESGECGDAHICSDEGVCVAQKANGEPCLGSSDCLSYHCDDGGHCAEPPRDFTKDVGEPCEIDPDCKPDLYCHEGTCVAKAAAGESCEAYTPCVRAAYCQLEGDGLQGLCVERIPVGGACEDSDHCTTGVCDGGKCEKLSGLGGPCSTDQRCFGVCDDGACAPPPVCPEE